jgi:predicted secreted protein
MKILASSVTALAIVAVPFALAAGPANTQAAQQNPACGEREQIVASLGTQYDEEQQAVGMVDPSTVLEVYVSDSGTWTIVATGTGGQSCILFYGEGWDNGDGVIDARLEAAL